MERAGGMAQIVEYLPTKYKKRKKEIENLETS
jgi:hypothetical protein